jgi:hypothetical protein
MELKWGEQTRGLEMLEGIQKKFSKKVPRIPRIAAKG